LTILGFSSSPVIDGNVDRMVKAILEKSGKSTEFFNLSELSYGPCRACAHLCAGDNLCKLDDDLKHLYSKILSAEAIVLGTPTYFSNMNGFMAIFLERLWAFRHQSFQIEGKPFVVVSVGAIPGAPEKAIEAVKDRMNAYNATYNGSVWFESNIFPCFKCGYGLKCKIGGLYYYYGEKGQKNLKITKELFKRWEDSPMVVSKIEELGQKLKNSS
jgi:multimeric flavodoxin WrbA